jgi:hypothetical protein
LDFPPLTKGGRGGFEKVNYFCRNYSDGRLHGSIPPRNLEAYFEAQIENGATPEDWRTCCHVDKKK